MCLQKLHVYLAGMIELYTDGASSGNPGPGGYGTILRTIYTGDNEAFKGKLIEKEFSGGYRKTTNNRMELMAVIVGLEALKNLQQHVTVYSDSKYVIDAIDKKWVYGWIQKGFAGKKNKKRNLSKLHKLFYRLHNSLSGQNTHKSAQSNYVRDKLRWRAIEIYHHTSLSLSLKHKGNIPII